MTTQIEQASRLVADIALELHRDTKLLIDECIERAAFGVLFVLEVNKEADAIRALKEKP